MSLSGLGDHSNCRSPDGEKFADVVCLLAVKTVEIHIYFYFILFFSPQIDKQQQYYLLLNPDRAAGVS